MIIVNMACGLANRMFQYAFYLSLKERGYNVKVDFYKSATLPHENVPWNDIFPYAEIDQVSNFRVLILGGGANFLSRLRRKYLPSLTNVITMSTAFDTDLQIDDDRKDKYIIGVFQSAAMVEGVCKKVKQCFSFLPFTDLRHLQLEKEMQECESVAIHVRKGNDYQQRIWYQNTCTMDYYRKAIAEIKGKVKDPRFYVFTDNADWVRRNFTDFDYKMVEGNPVYGWGSHFDMQLMSRCKYNIISNSTYSWWGAYLNANRNKIVICPNIWFNPESCNEYTSCKLLCKGWIAL